MAKNAEYRVTDYTDKHRFEPTFKIPIIGDDSPIRAKQDLANKSGHNLVLKIFFLESERKESLPADGAD